MSIDLKTLTPVAFKDDIVLVGSDGEALARFNAGLATSAEIFAGVETTEFLTPANVVAAGDFVDITADAGAWDLSTGVNFTMTLDSNISLSASGLPGITGRSGLLQVVQDSTGSRTLTPSTNIDQIADNLIADALGSAAGATTLFSYIVRSSSSVVLVPVGVLA